MVSQKTTTPPRDECFFVLPEETGTKKSRVSHLKKVSDGSFASLIKLVLTFFRNRTFIRTAYISWLTPMQLTNSSLFPGVTSTLKSVLCFKIYSIVLLVAAIDCKYASINWPVQLARKEQTRPF